MKRLSQDELEPCEEWEEALDPEKAAKRGPSHYRMYLTVAVERGTGDAKGPVLPCLSVARLSVLPFLFSFSYFLFSLESKKLQSCLLLLRCSLLLGSSDRSLFEG